MGGGAKKPRGMKEQSQIDAMRAAVRGDFERSGLTLRPAVVAEPGPEPEQPASEPEQQAVAAPVVEEPAPPAEPEAEASAELEAEARVQAPVEPEPPESPAEAAATEAPAGPSLLRRLFRRERS